MAAIGSRPASLRFHLQHIADFYFKVKINKHTRQASRPASRPLAAVILHSGIGAALGKIRIETRHIFRNEN